MKKRNETTTTTEFILDIHVEIKMGQGSDIIGRAFIRASRQCSKATRGVENERADQKLSGKGECKKNEERKKDKRRG